MTIVSSQWPDRDDIGEFDWRISVFTAANRPVPLAGRSQTHEAALHDMVVKARAYMAQEPGPFIDRTALHVNRKHTQVQGITDPNLSVDDIVARITAAYDAIAAADAERERRQREIDAIPVLSPTPAGSVREAWHDVESWLTVNTDYTADNRMPTQELTGIDGWPDELVEFLELYSGAPYRLLPLNALLTVEQIHGARRSMSKVWAGLAAEDPEMVDASASAQPAGTPAYAFIQQYIPFAGLDGYFWFVDTRPGPMHGCVAEYSRESNDEAGPKWVSISSMLTDLADSLAGQTVFDRMWLPSVTDGELDWQIRS
ncbi:hypothetical protein [Rhodococcus sp. 14-1411-2a]|uniref:hypothetical protein n=1 Tax=Rhodococcus sp. 14-1411-2a TaxID=2023151 RepID=UPI000B9ADB38|nr:hypothetical protein [Rhodococcus sp. 14-1411-2a]OZF44459.1 hypothetical protein CH291_18860 [Rhodococcus sp. 14-1411-2a]